MPQTLTLCLSQLKRTALTLPVSLVLFRAELQSAAINKAGSSVEGVNSQLHLLSKGKKSCLNILYYNARSLLPKLDEL